MQKGPSTMVGCLLIFVIALVCIFISASAGRGTVAGIFGVSALLLLIGGGIGWPIYVAIRKSKQRVQHREYKNKIPPGGGGYGIGGFYGQGFGSSSNSGSRGSGNNNGMGGHSGAR